jgi:ABC-type branched-chain amino acid transport system, permease component
MRLLYKFVAVISLLLASTLVLPAFAVTLLSEVCILGLFAMSLDLMVGYARLISFGHAGAYGLGAYACALMLLHTDIPLPFVLVLSALFSGVLAIGIGWVCTTATGISFAMLTLAFGQLFYAVVVKWTSVTNGSDGLVGIVRTAGPFGWEGLATRNGFYVLCGFCLIGAYFLCRVLIRSPFGNVLLGIRDNESKVSSLGFNTRRYKIGVIAISYMLGGLAGALYVGFAKFASPDLVFWPVSGQVLIMVILGGSGTLLGPIIGAAFYMLVEYQLGVYTEAWALILGSIFILSVIFMPRGILGLFSKVKLPGAALLPGRAVNEARY